jgi:hypothetical protein
MGLFSSGPNYSDRVERLLDIVYDSNNDAKRRDALDKMAKADTGIKGLGAVAYESKFDTWIREEAIDKLEYARANDELDSLVSDLSDERLRLKCIDALGSIGATSELGDIAHYYDGKDDKLSQRAFKYL